MDRRMQHPNVRLPPPLIFAAFLLLSWLLHRQVQAWALAPGQWEPWLRLAGWIPVLAGSALSVWSITAFRRARTAIMPMYPASRLVVCGPYRHSRNPMYVSLLLIYAGLALIYNSAWPLLLLPVLWTLVHAVIRREERHLTHAFGEHYARYMRTTGRWWRVDRQAAKAGL